MTFASGSRLETIGSSCFSNSGIEEVTLPGTLKEINEYAFSNCNSLKTVWVEDGCAPDIKKCCGDNVGIFPAKTMVGSIHLRDLRKQKHTVIPEGVQEIGEQWFKSSEVESIIIPVSVEEI